MLPLCANTFISLCWINLNHWVITSGGQHENSSGFTAGRHSTPTGSHVFKLIVSGSFLDEMTRGKSFCSKTATLRSEQVDHVRTTREPWRNHIERGHNSQINTSPHKYIPLCIFFATFKILSGSVDDNAETSVCSFLMVCCRREFSWQ